MSETRRQLFRVSVLSAFGAISLPALAGCGIHGLLAPPAPSNTDIPAVGKGDDNKYWYLFVYDSERRQYRVWRTEEQPPSDPHTYPFDTALWYSELEGKRNALTLMKKGETPPVKIGGHVYDTDSDGYLTGTAENTLHRQASATKWMEIYKQ